MAAWTSLRTSGLTLRRAVDDPRHGRPGDARQVGDLLQGGAGAPGATAGLGHVNSDSLVRALSRSMQEHSSPCQESALTTRSVSVRRSVGACATGCGTALPGCRRGRRGAMRHYGDGATTAAGRAADHDDAAAARRYEAVIGIEVHCQLRTASKMFCGCSTDLRRRAAEQPHLPGLPRPAGRAAGHQPARRRARAGDRRWPSGRRVPAVDPLGPQELLLPGPAQGLPDQPVRPAAGVARAADVRDLGRAGHRRASRRAHLEEDTARLVHADRRRRAAGQPRRLQPLRHAAHGDRHRARPPHGRAGAPLRRGAAAAAGTIGASDAAMESGQMRVEANVSLRPRGTRAVRDARRGQEHELVPGRGAGDRRSRSSARRGPRRRRAAASRRRAAGTTSAA